MIDTMVCPYCHKHLRRLGALEVTSSNGHSVSGYLYTADHTVTTQPDGTIRVGCLRTLNGALVRPHSEIRAAFERRKRELAEGKV